MAKKTKRKTARKPGRPRVVPEKGSTIVTVKMDGKALAKLARIGKALGTTGRSATIRKLIEQA